MEDGATKRREYLRTVAVQITWCAVTICLLVGITFVVGGSLLSGRELHYHVSSETVVLVVVLVTGAAFMCAAAWRRLSTKVRSIPYVPPIAKQPATLPAGEVLLRSSDQPAAGADELLRAAVQGAETEATELLRPNENSGATL